MSAAPFRPDWRHLNRAASLRKARERIEADRRSIASWRSGHASASAQARALDNFARSGVADIVYDKLMDKLQHMPQLEAELENVCRQIADALTASATISADRDLMENSLIVALSIEAKTVCFEVRNEDLPPMPLTHGGMADTAHGMVQQAYARQMAMRRRL